MSATQYDFFGGSDEDLGPVGAGSTAPGQAADPNDATQWKRDQQKQQPKDLIHTSNPSVGALGAGGGATGAYDALSDKGRDAFDYYRDIRDPGNINDYFDAMGERVGVSHAGDAAIGGVSDTLGMGSGFDILDRVVDPNSGLGTNAGNGGRPITALTPNTAAAAGVLQGATPNSPGGLAAAGVGGVNDALTSLLGGLGGNDIPIDASGADRGGMADYSGDLNRVRGLADGARGLGADVLSGAVAGPNAADAQRQSDALGKVNTFAPKAAESAAKAAKNFAAGPKEASGVLADVNAFAKGPAGPSSASLLQDEASQKAMADVLSVSRSGRARDAGSQARAANVAQAEIASMGVDNARNAALLRNKEANDARAQQLQALGLSGDLAQGLDTTKLGALNLQGDLAKSRDSSALQALGLGSDLATQMRGQGISERGQGLDFMQGQQQIGAGLESDVLKTIPQLEQIRHDDQFELTPQQKLAAAKLGGPPDKTTTDYVVGLLGDVLGVL
jgi:hypothetical protein